MFNRVHGLQFQVVSDEHRKHPEAEITLPIRATMGSAGYDFFSPADAEVSPFDKLLLWTDVKAKIPSGLMLIVNVRSSMGKLGIRLANTLGVVDSDYYSNPSNDGNIGIFIENTSEYPFHIKAGDRIAQGLFMPYFVTEDDETSTSRTGGIGSTGK